MKSRFICNVSNSRLLRNRVDKGEGFEVEYVVERVVYLLKREFIPFRERLLEDEPNIAKYQEDMFIDKNERSLFMAQVIKDWTAGTIGMFGNLSTNRILAEGMTSEEIDEIIDYTYEKNN